MTTKEIASDKFKVLFERAADAHLILDESGILDCNDAAVRLLKSAGKEEVLRIHPAALSPERQPDGRLSIEKSREMDALALKNGLHRFEWVHRNLAGEDFPVEVALNAVEIDGKPAWIAVWHDLTERKHAEDRLRRYQNRLQAELQVASGIQKSLLPQKSPFIRGIKTSWLFEPCDELGGDSLNIFTLDEKHVGFYVLDVAGHGVPASLVSVAASHFLSPYSEYSFLRGVNAKRIQDSSILCPQEVLGRLNDQFCSHPAFNGFMTLVYGILNPDTRELAYASAGHPAMAHVSRGKTKFLRQGGPPIGVMAGSEYPVERVTLEKGDRIYLYSDGVTEARTSRGELFGEKRLQAILEGSKSEPLDRVLPNLFTAIQSCVQGSRLEDDVTMLAVEISA